MNAIRQAGPTEKTVHQPSEPVVSIDDKRGYKPGTMYAKLLAEGSRDFWQPADLVASVAQKLGHDPRTVEYALRVLRNRNHRSNKGRSTAEIDADGRIRLIAL